MAQKVTIKDVAREAGVSVATVSYVVNNRTDLRISDATRKKVLQVINLLNYTPNQAAKALAANRRNLLAIVLPSNGSVLKKAEQMYMIQFLSEYLQEQNYKLLLLSDHYHEKCDQADAIICYDISSEYFRELGDNNFIPLIALDCIVNDPLFFEVNTDYRKLRQMADRHFSGEEYQYLCLETPNKEKSGVLTEHFPDCRFVKDYNDLADIRNRNLLVTDHTLNDILTGQNNVCFISDASSIKASALLHCIEDAIQRTPIEQHQILV